MNPGVQMWHSREPARAHVPSGQVSPLDLMPDKLYERGANVPAAAYVHYPLVPVVYHPGWQITV